MTAEEPVPAKILAEDGTSIATYSFGNPDHPTVLAVHGFASSALINWHVTGWTRDLLRAGFYVLAIDQRGHGASDKPVDPAAYTLSKLVGDLQSVLDAYMLGPVDYLGYSLGARVGWQACLAMPERIGRAVLGGIPDGLPLRRFRIEDARRYILEHEEVEDPLTNTYLTIAERIPGNRLEALVALVEGAQSGPAPSHLDAPSQPVLFATGSDDRIIEASRELAAAAPNGRFFEIPGRNHFNAPTSRAFRDAAIEFLLERDQTT